MAQDIFLSLWEHRDRLASVTSFSSYLFSIAQYTIYNFYDHQKVEHKYLYEYLAKHPSDSYSEEETLFARELDRMVDQVINNLSPQRRRVYLMSRKEGLSNEEIAQRLGISRRTVDNHLTAVLAILRRTILFYLCLFYL